MLPIHLLNETGTIRLAAFIRAIARARAIPAKIIPSRACSSEKSGLAISTQGRFGVQRGKRRLWTTPHFLNCGRTNFRAVPVLPGKGATIYPPPALQINRAILQRLSPPARFPGSAPALAGSLQIVPHACGRCGCRSVPRYPCPRASCSGVSLSPLAIGTPCPSGSGPDSAGPAPAVPPSLPGAWGCSSLCPFALPPV